MTSREDLHQQPKKMPHIEFKKTVQHVDPQVQEFNAERKNENLHHISHWIQDVIIAVIIAVCTVGSINILVGASIQYDWFGEAESEISQIWPSLMPFLGILIGLETFLHWHGKRNN